MRPLLIGLVVVLSATACAGSDEADQTTTTSTPTTTAEQTTTTPPSTAPATTVSRGNPRAPTTDVPTGIGPGEASLVGNVVGPEGPVDGAVVQVERFVRDSVATAEVVTQDGTWSLPSILGGSYRVRVFRPPDLAQPAPEVFFLGATETKTINTTLVRHGSSSVTASIEPNPPVLGQPAVLAVQFGSGSVDPGGQVRTAPRAGQRVQLNVGPDVALDSAPVVVSDGSGVAAWQVRCLQPGQFSVSVVVGNTSWSLVLPACTPPEQAPPAEEEPAG